MASATPVRLLPCYHHPVTGLQQSQDRGCLTACDTQTHKEARLHWARPMVASKRKLKFLFRSFQPFARTISKAGRASLKPKLVTRGGQGVWVV